MLTFQIGSVTIQASESKAVVMAVKSMIAGTALEICPVSGASMDVPREITGPSAITMLMALIKPIPPNQTRMEPIRRANAAVSSNPTLSAKAAVNILNCNDFYLA
jgi:hypothetical protein